MTRYYSFHSRFRQRRPIIVIEVLRFLGLVGVLLGLIYLVGWVRL